MTKQVTIKWPPTQQTIAVAVLVTCVVVYNLFCLWGLTLDDASGGVAGFICELLCAGVWAAWVLKKSAEDKEAAARCILYELGYDWCYHDDKWKSREERDAERKARYAEISTDHRMEYKGPTISEKEYNEQG